MMNSSPHDERSMIAFRHAVGHGVVRGATLLFVGWLAMSVVREITIPLMDYPSALRASYAAGASSGYFVGNQMLLRD